MKKNQFLDGHYIGIVGVVIFVFYIANVLFMSYTIRSSYSERIIRALGAMTKTYGEISKEVVDSVMNSSDETYAEGKIVLKKYGYYLSGDTLIKNSMNREILDISVLLFISIAFLLTSLYFMFKKKRRSMTLWRIYPIR